MSAEVSTECLVIGAGPAGLQASYLLSRAGRDHLVLEAEDVPGAFFTRFPRHRTLISINKPITGARRRIPRTPGEIAMNKKRALTRCTSPTPGQGGPGRTQRVREGPGK